MDTAEQRFNTPSEEKREQEFNPSFDAALVHGFWLSQKGDNGEVKLSLRSRLAVRSAALSYQSGLVGNIVFTVGKIWGEEYPSVAEKMAEELEKKYHVPHGHIVVEADAVSTKKEVDTFLRLAQERGWTRLLDIAPEKHLWTIPDIYKHLGQNISTKSVEEIIKEKDKAKVKKLVDRLGRSKYELAFMFYEAGVWIAMRFDRDYSFMDNLTTNHRNVKSPAGIPGILGKILPSMDVNKL